MNWAVLKIDTLAITAAVYAVLGTIALNAGLFGIWLGILLLLSFWRYAYKVLRTVAQGRRELDAPDIESMNPIGEIVLLLHFAAFPGLVIALSPYPAFGLIAAVLAVLLFPASAAIMGLSSSIEAAFNPAAIGDFVKTLGRDYWVLVAACIAIYLFGILIGDYLLPRLGYLSSALSFAVELWVVLAIFALIGSSLYEHRQEFEIPGEKLTQEDYDAGLKLRQWQVTLDRAYASIRSGLVDSGYKTLKELIAANGASTEIQFWMVENMLDWEEKHHALAVARLLIAQLVETDDDASALDLYKRCSWHDAKFSLPAPIAERLGAYAEAIGRQGLASQLAAAAATAPQSAEL